MKKFGMKTEIIGVTASVDTLLHKTGDYQPDPDRLSDPNENGHVEEALYGVLMKPRHVDKTSPAKRGDERGEGKKIAKIHKKNKKQNLAERKAEEREEKMLEDELKGKKEQQREKVLRKK